MGVTGIDRVPGLGFPPSNLGHYHLKMHATDGRE